MTTSPHDPQLENLLNYLKHNRGIDFTGYKRPSIMRRVNKRMQLVNIETYDDYLDYLEVHPEEFLHLFNTLLINVTAFFRDRPSWDYLSAETLPHLVAQKPSGEVFRVWSAGCATGEECYSLAIALAEIVGLDNFRERVKIYATDVDEEALNHARLAAYAPKDVAAIPPELLEKYFEQHETCYTIRKELRQAMIFGRHSLIQDAPISKVDLLACRNTLMYFNAETQSRILARFHFALRDGGILFLGKAEMLLSHSAMFTPVSLKCRIFTKVPKVTLRDRFIVAQMGNNRTITSLSNYMRLRDPVFDSSPGIRLLIDTNGILALANERARQLFNITPRDIGRPLQDLQVSYHPIELRSCIELAHTENRAVNVNNVEWQTNQSDLLYFDVEISPLLDGNQTLLGTAIVFTDVTRYKRLQEELEHANQELEMAYEELQSTNEELETTNEELQSANEELETTNEELQSTNEELETMNEELQSTNEELETVNDELQRRSEELNQINAFLETILTSLKGGVVVVNRDLQVLVWNRKAEDLWGLRTSEAVGQNFLNLDIGLPVEQLRPAIRACLSSAKTEAIEVMLVAINRRGKTIQCDVTATCLLDTTSEVQGVILLMGEKIE